MDDIRRFSNRIRQAKDRMRWGFSADSAQAAYGSPTRLKMESRSPRRIANYADNCIRIPRVYDSRYGTGQGKTQR